MSSIFEGFLSTPEVLQAFGERSLVDAMLRFEASLARAQAAVGLIPESAAQSIIGTCKVDLFDVAKIVRESPRSGSLAIPLVTSLKETVGLFNPAAVAHVHRGCTSQDTIDTAMALVTRAALDLIVADVGKSVQALLALAQRYADTLIRRYWHAHSRSRPRSPVSASSAWAWPRRCCAALSACAARRPRRCNCNWVAWWVP